MRLHIESGALYTDAGHFLKHLRCPLEKRWEELEIVEPSKTDRLRRCTSCATCVHNLTGLSDAEAEQLIRADGDACVALRLDDPNLQLVRDDRDLSRNAAIVDIRIRATPGSLAEDHDVIRKRILALEPDLRADHEPSTMRIVAAGPGLVTSDLFEGGNLDLNDVPICTLLDGGEVAIDVDIWPAPKRLPHDAVEAPPAQRPTCPARIIKTARGLEDIRRMTSRTLRPLIVPVPALDGSCFRVWQHRTTGMIELQGDERYPPCPRAGHPDPRESPWVEVLERRRYSLGHPCGSDGIPLAAYMIPVGTDALRVGEQVFLEDIIEQVAETRHCQGHFTYHRSGLATWNGEGFEFPRLETSFVVG